MESKIFTKATTQDSMTSIATTQVTSPQSVYSFKHTWDHVQDFKLHANIHFLYWLCTTIIWNSSLSDFQHYSMRNFGPYSFYIYRTFIIPVVIIWPVKNYWCQFTTISAAIWMLQQTVQVTSNFASSWSRGKWRSTVAPRLICPEESRIYLK